MTTDRAVDFAVTQHKLVMMAELALELDVEGFLDWISSGSAPTADVEALRDLAVAAAALQRVAHRQLTASTEAA